MEVYRNDVLGVQVADTAGLELIEDRMLAGDSYGFTLIRSDQHRGDGHAHQEMVLRVGWRYRDAPDPQRAVAELSAEYEDVTMSQEEIPLHGTTAIMVTGVPGRHPFTYLYLVKHGQLYELTYNNATLDDFGHWLIQQLHFEPPSHPLDSLGLPEAVDTENLGQSSPYPSDVPKVPETGIPPLTMDPAELEAARGARGPIQPGAVDWPSAQFLQTPITKTANGNGFSWAGPSYYGEGFHNGTDQPRFSNDHYALDFSLRPGDEVLSPFPGTVRWTGVGERGWHTLGRLVIVETRFGSDKYWALSAHLSSIKVQRGDTVTADTVIGLAGGSGKWSAGSALVENRFDPHLHMAIFLNAELKEADSGVHSGRSVRPVNMRFFRVKNGVYPTITDRQVISY